MPLNECERIREKAIFEMLRATRNVRYYLSFTDGNGKAVESLKDGSKPLEEILHKLVEHLLRHMGHEGEGFIRNPRGATARAAKRLAGV